MTMILARPGTASPWIPLAKLAGVVDHYDDKAKTDTENAAAKVAAERRAAELAAALVGIDVRVRVLPREFVLDLHARNGQIDIKSPTWSVDAMKLDREVVTAGLAGLRGTDGDLDQVEAGKVPVELLEAYAATPIMDTVTTLQWCLAKAVTRWNDLLPAERAGFFTSAQDGGRAAK